MASLSVQAGIPAAHAVAADEQDVDMHDAVAVVATTAPASVATSAEGGVVAGSAAGKEAAHAAADEPVKITAGMQYAAVSQQQQQQLAALMAAEAEPANAVGDEQHQDMDHEQAEVSALVGGNSADIFFRSTASRA
jgi:hypothetical protein